MQIDLNKCFPLGTDGTQKPLPKQEQFLGMAMDPSKAKYIAYVGGVGSGKTLIGCITTLTWAFLYPGDYLVCRQFFPELKMTTYKTFLEICPPELIEENRVADMQIRIRALNGKISNVYFRPAEEPDKFRSLNLSGFYLDEANQISEEAYMLLQGRLRGGGIRKGIITTNPKGHDWIYRWHLKKDHLNDPLFKEQFQLIMAPSTENIHLPDGYVKGMLASWSEERIQREIYGSFDAFEGAVYPEFRRDVHVVRPFRIPHDWRRDIRIDHGFRNPACVGFYATSPDGEVYLYKELYVREYLIEEIIKGSKKEGKKGILDIAVHTEKFETAKIDPSVKATRGRRGGSEYDEYMEYWPKKFPPLQLAQNDVALGIQRVKSYLKIQPNGKPLLYVFSTCTNTIEEFCSYQWEEQTSASSGRKNESEKPRKVNDHAMDQLRYMIVDCPEPNAPQIDEMARHKKYSNVEIAFQDEISKLRRPKEKGDPFDDGI